MNTVKEMLRTHPEPRSSQIDMLAGAVEHLFNCQQACVACADACLGEEQVAELVRCINLNIICADTCETVGKVLSRQTEPMTEIARPLVQACAIACAWCGEECNRHSKMHEHCRICAEICRECQQVCEQVLTTMSR